MSPGFQRSIARVAIVGSLLAAAACAPGGKPQQTVTDDTRGRLAEALLASGDETNAAAALSPPSAHAFERSPDALTNVSLLISAGQIDRAMKAAKAAIAARGDDPDFALDAARLAVKANRWSDAGDFYTEVLRRHADNIEALNGESVVQAQQGDLAEAAELERKALALQPQNVAARYNLALITLLSGQNQQAVSMLESLNQVGPTPQVATLLAFARDRLQTRGPVGAPTDEHRRLAIDGRLPFASTMLH
jgi:Flp pilus assembly protein TadD